MKIIIDTITRTLSIDMDHCEACDDCGDRRCNITKSIEMMDCIAEAIVHYILMFTK